MKVSSYARRLSWRVFWLPLLVGVCLLVTVFVGMTFWDRANCVQVKNMTLEFMTNQVNFYVTSQTSDQVKSLVRLQDKIKALSYSMERTGGITQQDLDDYVQHQRLDRVILTDGDLQCVLVNTGNEVPEKVCAELLEMDVVRDILRYPKKSYMTRLNVDGINYDVAVIARSDANGLMIGVDSKDNLVADPQDVTLNTLFAGFTFEMDGVAVLTDGENVLSTSDPELKGMTQDALRAASKLDRIDDSAELVYLRFNGKNWYGGKSQSNGYQLYAFFPAFRVFETRAIVSFISVTLYVIAWLTLVTIRVRNERQDFEQSQKQLHTVQSISSIYSFTYLVHLPTNTIEFIQMPLQMVERLRGKTDAAAALRLLRNTYLAEEYRAAHEAFADLSTLSERLHGRKCLTFTYRDVRDEWYQSFIIPQSWDKRGDVESALFVTRNVSEEKRREVDYQNQLRKSAEQAERANAVKTDFLRSMSHDIRTPINGIRGMVNIGRHYLNDPKKEAECLDKIMSASGFLLDLVNNVLDMSKLEAGSVRLDKKPFDLHAICREVVNIIENTAQEHGVIVIADQLQAMHTQLIGSPLHLRQVLLNIAGNAVKYSHPAGTVHLSCRELSAEADTAHFAFTCADTGVGMSKEFQQHAFEPFAQESANARTAYAGTGLGLAIAKELVEKMGGTISFTSELGVGTTFVLDLPFKVQQAVETAVAPAQQYAEDLHGFQVMLVEDNNMNVEIGRFLLQEEGADVTVVRNGQQAVERFSSAEPGSFDVILMDVMMPVMNGLDATRAIRALERPDAKEIPIIAMTANAFADDVERSLQAGMDEHLTKPLDPVQVVQAIHRHCRK